MTTQQRSEPLALESARLPRFVFIDDDGKEEIVALSSETARVRAVASCLSARVAPGTITGLAYRSGRDLVTNWLACLVAGLRPLILQYPTRKQSRTYWSDSIRNTIAVAGVGAVVSDTHCAAVLRESEIAVTIISQDELARVRDEDATPFRLADFSVIQLSSGTTGYRKALEFHAAQLFSHIHDYNVALELTPHDRVVSWLPLYHDMGYIGCFVMPMLLGIDVVMMDPMSWIRQPVFLFEAIERHAGTVCYMPNFGYEVMTRLGARRLPTMRWWICGSEPISPHTIRKFGEVMDADPNSLASLYGMVENVLAASIRRGLVTREIDGVDVVSCGRPIANTEIKEVDGELWVRSPTSLTSYIGGDDIRDSEGFFPTGDLGRILEGEIFATGRKQDLMIQAGRKYMLSDIDLALNRLYPWVKGRAVAVQVYDARLGTQKPLVLVEAEDFFLRKEHFDIANALAEATGLDYIGVEFVPPRFLTKTSSGKFNRKKSAADWLAAKQAQQNPASRADPVAELRESFPYVDWNAPVEEILDSLSLELLRIILGGTGVAYDGARTLASFAEGLSARESTKKDRAPETIRIVSLADRNSFDKLREEDIDRLAQALGKPVTFEHVCLPPSPIILSDLIFHDWFQPRAEGGNFTAVDRAFEKLKSASVIIVDDASEMLIGGSQAPGALSHNLERDPNCDLISYRWQRYAQYHDTLPLTFVSGADLNFEHRTEVIGMLGAYLETPIFKIALTHGFEQFTESWDYRANTESGKGVRRLAPQKFTQAFLAWLDCRGAPLKSYPTQNTEKIQMNDLGHFCAHVVQKRAIATVVSKFKSFCIAGRPSSVPYLRKELDRLGKPYTYAASYSREVLAKLPHDYECLLICGPQGEYEVDKPTVALMQASSEWRVRNTDDPDLLNVPFKQRSKYHPPSGTDWFCPFPVERDANLAHHDRALEANRSAKQARSASQKHPLRPNHRAKENEEIE